MLRGLIPESAPLVQSVTSGRPATHTTPLATFAYRHVRPGWFFGYESLAVDGGEALVALPEKALLDIVYLSSGPFGAERIAALRLQSVDRIDPERIRELAERGGAPRLLRAAAALARFIEAEGQA